MIEKIKMKGTEGGDYTVVAAFRTGKIGFRDLSNGTVRVRVEIPTKAMPGGAGGGSKKVPAVKLKMPRGWKKPEDGNPRYSKVVSRKNLGKVLDTATHALLHAA